MMAFVKLLLFAVISALATIFPVSGHGHALILPAFLHMDTSSLDVAVLWGIVQVATGVGILAAMWPKWHTIAHTQKNGSHTVVALVITMLIGTILVSLLGAFTNMMFADPMSVAAFITMNGFLLYAVQMMSHNKHAKPAHGLAKLTYAQAGVIGLLQIFAAIPGISSVALLVSGGLLQGLNFAESVQFSMLAVAPMLIVLGIFQGADWEVLRGIIGSGTLVFLLSLITAFIAVNRVIKLLDRYMLTPYIYYCWVIGILFLFVLKLP